jgi:hypothetical protein
MHQSNFNELASISTLFLDFGGCCSWSNNFNSSAIYNVPNAFSSSLFLNVIFFYSTYFLPITPM